MPGEVEQLFSEVALSGTEEHCGGQMAICLWPAGLDQVDQLGQQSDPTEVSPVLGSGAYEGDK
jgi:hypothetical protein